MPILTTLLDTEQREIAIKTEQMTTSAEKEEVMLAYDEGAIFLRISFSLLTDM